MTRRQKPWLYWIDRLGNKELLYRDPTISCLIRSRFGPGPGQP